MPGPLPTPGSIRERSGQHRRARLCPVLVDVEQPGASRHALTEARLLETALGEAPVAAARLGWGVVSDAPSGASLDDRRRAQRQRAGLDDDDEPLRMRAVTQESPKGWSTPRPTGAPSVHRMPESLVDLALAEARRALDERAAVLRDTRARIGLVFPVTGVLSALLAAPALRGHKGVPALGILAVLALLISTGAAMVVLWPRPVMPPGGKATVILGPDWAHLGPEEATRELALHTAVAAADHDRALGRVWPWLRVAIVAAVVSLVLWLVLLLKGP